MSINNQGKEIPRTSQLEEGVEELFDSMKIDSEADLDRVINTVFTEICGDYGRAEFFGIAVPSVKSIYGDNRRKAGLRLLDIIDKGAERKPDQIGGYFEKAVSEAELEFSKKSKEEVLKEIEAAVNDLILRKKEELGEQFGIVAAVIYGSYAKRNFNMGSDVDIFYIESNSEKKDGFDEEEGQFIRYFDGPHFDRVLDRKIRPETDNFFGTVYIGDEDELVWTVSDSMIKNEFVIVTPYPEIEEKLQDIFSSQEKPSA